LRSVNEKWVDLRKLKSFAVEQLPKKSALREVLVTEKDSLDVIEFLAKAEIWLRLISKCYSDGG